MKSQGRKYVSMHRTNQWQSLVGQAVEVRVDGGLYRRGVVDRAMRDGSGLWLASEAVFGREFIDSAAGVEVWTRLYPRSRWDNAASAADSEAATAEGRERIAVLSGGAA